MPYDDDEDDWVGTPPEGRHSRDKADPDFWKTQRPLIAVSSGALGLLLVVVLILALT